MARGRDLPPSDRYLEGARLASANALRLVRAARLLRADGLYGPAATLLATAAEEAAKAGVLAYLLEGEGDDGEYADLLRGILSDHRTRFALAEWALGWSRPPEPISRPVSEARDQIGMGLIGLIAMLLVAIYLAKRPEPANGTTSQQEPQTDWLKSLLANPSEGAGKASEAFALRNRGLYVDYVGGHWRSPAGLGAAEERTMRAFAVPLVRGTTMWRRELGR